jgi:PadR family transcriptional regulator AphA
MLGLLAVAPFTAHELTVQAARSLHWVWPRSERSLYTEPKRLITLGWARATERSTGTRAVPEYRITDAGRTALREWLASAPAEPATEIELLLRVVFADGADVDDLRQALVDCDARLHATVRERLVPQCREYLADGGPYPERLHLIGLFSEFYLRFVELLDNWTEYALTEIETWPSSRAVGMTPAARQTFERVVERYGAAASTPGE